MGRPTCRRSRQPAAGELRARAGAGSALVCLWRPGGEALRDDDDPASPAGATTPAARRVAAALEAEGLRATACGRLAWLALPDDPEDAAPVLRRGLALAAVPVVIAVAGPRPAAFEPVLATADLALAVLPADAAAPLRDLALASLPGFGHIVAPLPPGPPRWAALTACAPPLAAGAAMRDRLHSYGRSPAASAAAAGTSSAIARRGAAGRPGRRASTASAAWLAVRHRAGPSRPCSGHRGDQHLAAADGQAAILLLGALMAVLAGAFVLGAVAKAVGTGLGAADRRPRRARRRKGDARGVSAPLRAVGHRGEADPQHLEKAAYLELGGGGRRGRPPQWIGRHGHRRRLPRRGHVAPSAFA